MTLRAGDEDGKNNAGPMMKPSPISSTEVPTAMDAVMNRTTSSGFQRVPIRSNPPSNLAGARASSDAKSSPHSTPVREGSPRSEHSGSSQTPPAGRRPTQGCKYETGMAKARRRIPYSQGDSMLDPEPTESKRSLSPEQSQQLTTEMAALYAQLLPSPESEDRRYQFVKKLELFLHRRWPSAKVSVSVFGSSGNRLGTSDSDVDICITTDYKEIENVCLIAELLAQNGMQRIVCVSSAKVPIVKVWDPELQVACDMNVNNPIALKNTEMIRSYIELDPRVRPLCMVVKHWAKRRMLNDAALGGTLSSYTWMCMALNFLQTRDPPVLPSLQQSKGLAPEMLRGVNVAFDRNLAAYRNFGSRNQSTLGELLFQFFQYFGHQLDFERSILSIRLGKVIPKSEKGWQMGQNNRLCVEEPFNTGRNLANTADDTSMRGIHQELRRAHGLLVRGELNKCCEQFAPAPEEHRSSATFVHPVARPIIPQAPISLQPPGSRASRSYRSNRPNHRNAASRRASNPVRHPNYLHDLPFQMTPQELQLQAQHQQHLLHDQLFQQYQYLQAQEAELRLQLYQQNLRQRGIMSQHGQGMDSSTAMRLPVSPTVFQNRFGTISPFMTPTASTNGIMTNPASPMLATAAPVDNQRFTRRSSMATPSQAGSLRAQSQPARPIPMTNSFDQTYMMSEYHRGSDQPRSRRTSFASHTAPGNIGYLPPSMVANNLYEAGRRPAEFMGYYVGHSPLLAASMNGLPISPLPSHAGLNIQNGGLSPHLSSRTSRLPSGMSSPLMKAGVPSGPDTYSQRPPSPPSRGSPLIVDGSINSPKRRQHPSRNLAGNSDSYTISTTASDEFRLDTPSTSEDQFQDFPDPVASVVNGLHSSAPGHDLSESMSRMSIDPMKHDVDLVDLSRIEDGHPGQAQQWRDSGAWDGRAVSPTGIHGIAQAPATGERSPGSSNANQLVSMDLRGFRPDRDILTIPARDNKLNGEPASATQPTAAEVLSGWKTQKRKKKSRKAHKSESDISGLNGVGGEPLPLDERLRKGG